MKFEQEKIVSLGNAIHDLETQKKEISKESTEVIDNFLTENSLEKKHKKALKNAIKSYLKWKKDRAKFLEEEYVYNEILDVATGEKAIRE